MAAAVLDRAQARVEGEILQVAQAPESLRRRVRKVVAALEQMYSGGRTPCVLGQLAVASLGPSARAALHVSFQRWVAAIAKLARDGGMTEARSREFAEDWVARLQGALIVQAANGNVSPFERALKSLLDLAKSTDLAKPAD